MTERHPVHALSHDFVEALCAVSPLGATFTGVRGFDDRWDDFGPDGQAAREACYRAFGARLDALPPATEPFDALAVRVHREAVDERLAFYSAGDFWLDLGNIDSTFQHLPMALDFTATDTPEALEAVAARLEGLGAACASYRALLAEGIARGQVVARRQAEAAVRQGRAQAGERSRYRALAATCAASAEPALAERLRRAGEAGHTAIASLTDWIERAYLPRASDEDAVGRERYTRCVRRWLGDAIDLEEAYAWGWEEIRRIEAEMRAVAADIAPGATVREVAARLDRELVAELPEPFLDRMRERQARALALVDGHFDVPEALRRVDVRLAPPGGKVGAYYVGPSEDLSRSGTIWYSPGTRTAMPVWSEVATAYHEGVPGHHLQVGLQVSLADRLTRFHRLFASWSGYAEGWALYAEQLMLDLGGYEAPAFVLGMHLQQLARAWRVVVDIGLHLALAIPRDADFRPGERWSHAIAVEAMRDRALLSPEVAESEVVRYLGMPAQAISYKLGQRAMLELRDAVRRRDGSAFDLRRFHADVLGVGSVGLGVLREAILR